MHDHRFNRGSFWRLALLLPIALGSLLAAPVATGAASAAPAATAIGHASPVVPMAFEEADCSVGVFSSSCSSHAIPAHSSQHFIVIDHIQTPGLNGGTFDVIDAANGVSVFHRGLGDGQLVSGIVLSGLYSSGGYYCRVTNSAWMAGCEILNYT